MSAATLASVLDETAHKLRAAFEDGSPQVIRTGSALFETAEVFEWIKLAHPQARASSALGRIHELKRSWGLDVDELDSEGAPDPGRPAEIYKSGAMVLETAPFLPRPDHDFASWIRDTHAALGGEFGMQAPGLECASFEALERLQTLLAPTLALTGPRTYRYNAFVGDYARTPFGYHVDPHQEAVFQYVIEGKRRAHFWEGLTLQERDAVWVEDANALVEPLRPPEQSFELEPGDIVFWPGTHVHGFEPLGPSMALSMVIDRAAPMSREEVVRGLEIRTMGGKAALPPANMQTIVEAGMTLRRRSKFDLAHARWGDELIIGVCGRTLEWPDRDSALAALRVFDFVNGPQTIEVDEVVRACADATLVAEDVHEILTVLVNLRFLAPAEA